MYQQYSPSHICIYIYIYMIDCGETDSMIEIYGKLDESLKSDIGAWYFILFIPKNF